MNKKFSKSDIIKYQYECLSWNFDKYGYDKFCPNISYDEILAYISETKLINGLKKFINADGKIEIDFKGNYGLILSLYFEDGDDIIYLENVSVEFYHKINKIIEIDKSNLALTLKGCKRLIEVYKQFSNEEKLELELF